jgi:hypothetical protein
MNMNTFFKQGGITFTAALIFSGSTFVDAGVLEDIFGVFPKLDETAPAQYDNFQGTRTYHFAYDTLRPTQNPGKTFYTIDDWHGSWSSKAVDDFASDLNYHGNPNGNGKTPSGGEPYDVEAVYWGMDDENVYVALITSSPHPGYVDTRIKGESKFIVAGDIGIDLHQNNKHSSNFAYDYAINITEEDRPLFGNVTKAKSEVGNKLYRTKNSDWYTGTPKNAVAGKGHFTNFDPDYGLFGRGRGSYVGEVATSYYEYTFPGGLQEGLAATYVIEAIIPRKLIYQELNEINPDVQPYTSAETVVDTSVTNDMPVPEINISYLMGCRNDWSAQ